MVDACGERLRALNPFITVTTIDDDPCNGTIALLKEQKLSGSEKKLQFSCVVAGRMKLDEQLALDSLCRQLKIPFFSIESMGLFGSFFSDLGTFEYYTTYEKK